MFNASRYSCGAPATVHRRLREQSGQGAVEFGLIVPFLCVLVLALVDFGKGMNYWLDLNHVASDGARKAAVNEYPTAGDLEAYIRSRLETSELKAGGTSSIPSAATIAICLPEGGEIGDPVTIQVATAYHWGPSLPRIGGLTWNIRGTATMRLEQAASFSGSGACT